MGIPMAYNTGTTNTYTEKTVKRGTVALNPGPSLAPSYNWFNGVDVTATQYLIYSDTYTTGQATQANSRPTAWTTPDLSDTSLLNLINTLPERIGQTPFLYLPVALKWLYQSNRYFLLKNNFENIVTNGLILNLDASWPNSYSGTTTWFDLSGQKNNGILYNGVGFNGYSGGTLTFDGANDYIQMPFETILNDCTIEVWFRATSTKIYQYLLSIGDGGSSYSFFLDMNDSDFGSTAQTMWVYWNSGGNNYSVVPKTGTNIVNGTSYGDWNDSTWRCYTFTRSVTNAPYTRHYMNGVEVNNVSRANDQTTKFGNGANYKLTIGAYQSNNLNYVGDIPSVKIYNRVLSPAEIMQNFNTQSYKFGYTTDIPSIVTSGLTINLDAANGMSYPGSGTTWYDISQTGGYHFTLRNGASATTYNNVTCFSFDGSDDNARWVDTNGIREDIGTECTISIWMNGNGVDLGQPCCRLISFNNNVDINVDYSDYFCMAACNRIGYLPCYTGSFAGGLCAGGGGSNTPMYTTDFKLVTVRWSTISDTIETFVNNSSIYSASLTASPINYRDIKRIALASNASGIEGSNIRIASMQMYSRRLSDSELTQNYNAQKGRFGL